MFVKRALAVWLAGTAAIGVSGGAHAQSTPPAASMTTAGTPIENVASVTYTVNGTNQSTTSTTASFVVDRKVNFTVVTAQAGLTQVNLEQENAITTFRVTNLTNDVQDFLLDPDQQNIALGIFPGTDNFDMQNLRVFVDSNDNDVYDPDVDTATWIDELAPDASVAVFIVGNVPNQSNAAIAYNSLQVIAAAGGATGTQGALLIPTDLNLGNADDIIDVVFADDDSDGTFAGDIARNGRGRAYSGYEVGTRDVDLTVTKTARILSDGVNALNPKAIPGATVEYCLVVRNATLLTPANAVTLTDIVPANTTFVPDSISIGVPGLLGIACVASPVSSGVTGTYDSASNTVTANIDRVIGGGSVAASFRVTIN